MLPQNSRIHRLRVALRAAEWFFISVHVFDVVFIPAGFMDLESKVMQEKVNFYQMSLLYIQLIIQFSVVGIITFCFTPNVIITL